MSTISAGTTTTTSLVQTGDTTGNLVLTAVSGIVDASGGATNTGALTLPVGNTAQRPTAANGMMRYNTTTSTAEYYSGAGWVATTTPYLAQVLVVAGGGGSGGYGGAGGAGGVIQGTVTLVSGTNYSVTVGAGGTAAVNRNSAATNGGDSVFAYIRATGGGKGGSDNSNASYVASVMDGGSGGSGGGTSYAYVGTAVVGSGNTPSTTPAQGYGGATGGSSTNSFGGAGGGAGAAAGSFTGPLAAGNGGIGISSSITGSATYYGGGGGGSCSSASGTGGTGGLGGGGDGAKSTGGVAGTVNTGGGAGGGWTVAAAGGSGVVIVSILTAYYTGTTTGTPTITTNGAYTVMKFTASGTYTA